MTDPSGSQHSQVIDICGGINVADCQLTPGNGMTQVSMEQVMNWNPEVIITSSPQFYATVYSDPLWASVDAVKNKRVYLAPQNPFCWIDRPQGPHLIIGTAWTAKMLYPDLFKDMDLSKLTREFYSEFFHYDLTDKELDMLLNPSAEVKDVSEKGKSPDFPYIAENIFAPIYPVIAAHIVEQSGIKQGICLDLGCGIASLGIAVAEITDMQVYGVDFSD